MGRLGLDLGNVIMGGVENSPSGERALFFSDKFLEAPQMENAFASIRKLIAVKEGRLPGQFDPSDVFIVSRADPASALRTLRWLEHHNFYEETGFLDENNVFFCLERGDKAPIARRLGLTHFVDDRLEVLGKLKEVVPHRFAFCPSDREVHYHGQVLAEVTRVASWQEVLVHLLPGERSLVTVPEALCAA